MAERVDEMEDQTCDQTGRNSEGQEDRDQEPDEPEESDLQQDNVDNPAAMPNASPASAQSSSDENPPVDSKDMSSNGNNSLSSRESVEPDEPEESDFQQDNVGHTDPSAKPNASPASAQSSSEESPPVDRKDMPSNGNNSLLSRESVEPDEPEESDFQQDNVGHNPPAKPNASPASAQSSSEESPPVDRKDMPSNGNNSLLSRESVEPDEPEESDFQQDNVGHNPPAKPNASPASAQSSSDESPPVDRKDMPSNGNNSLLSRESVEPDEPEESDFQQDNVGHNPPAKPNASPASAQSSSEESPPGDRKDMPSNGNGNGNPSRRDLLRYGAIGLAAGTAAVVAAPVVLSAAGFTAGGVAAGSIAAAIQSAVYGGSVASGSAFALAQSAGAAGIGAASNAAIGGITGGIAALGARVLDRFRKGIKLLICGWSSEARVFASIASSVTGTEVRVLPDRSNMLTSDYKVTFHRRGEEPTCITSRPPIVKHNAEDAMKDVDIVVFILPFSAHEGFLEALRPYIKPGVIIVGLPGEPGFEFQVLEALGDVGQQCTIMNFESSPWVCRNAELGVDCEVLSTKETLLGAMKKERDVAPKKDPVSTLQSLLGPLPKLTVFDHQ